MTELLYHGWKDDAWIGGMATTFFGTILLLAGLDASAEHPTAGTLGTVAGVLLIALGALNIADASAGNRGNMLWLEAQMQSLLRN